MCAAAIVKPPPTEESKIPAGQVRIAFDGDAVLFDESSEIVYKSKGLDEFQRREDEHQDVPMEDGPYAVLLRKLARLQDRLPFSVEFSPVRIAIVTARHAPAEMRVIKTLRHWGVYVDEIFFLGGMDKAKVLKAFRPHIFFDDQDLNLQGNVVPIFNVRRATTAIELRDGQSFAIAGLLEDNFTDSVDQFPWLGDIPVLGTLFRSMDYSRGESELVIIVTVHLVVPVSEEELSLPHDNVRIPNEFELFLLANTDGAGAPGMVQTQGFDGDFGYVVE